MGNLWLIGYSFSHHLLFFSLPLGKSCEIRLEELRLARKLAVGCGRGASRKAACRQKHRMLPMASSQGAACPPRGHRGSSYLRPTRIGVAPIEGDAYGHGANHKGSCRWLRAAVAAQGQR
ncbi:hypothetical protein BHM03_00055856 [Ensete ventricosum]|nr:hypothetical protein BHM03_00055856 [Ensete ventricosum]